MKVETLEKILYVFAGDRLGVFSTRSPHRPNAIGLTLAKLESVEEGGHLSISGHDLLDGTPVIDVKASPTKEQTMKRGPKLCVDAALHPLLRRPLGQESR